MSKVRAPCNSLEPLHIRNAIRSIMNRGNKCLEVNGSNFEHLI